LTAQWTVTALLGAVVFLNSLAVIGLIRQVGLLHLRIRPVGALATEEGPKQGDELAFDRSPWDMQTAGAGADQLLLSFISPTCSLCDSLIRGLDSLAVGIRPRIGTVLLTDAVLDRATEYVRSRGSKLPILADDAVLRANDIPGTPYGVVIDRSHRVLAAGGVNSLEQLEVLIDAAAVQNEKDDSLVDTRDRGMQGQQERVTVGTED
jgi:methylamine dehydrogenase accessory protein MauD